MMAGDGDFQSVLGKVRSCIRWGPWGKAAGSPQEFSLESEDLVDEVFLLLVSDWLR